MPRRHPPLGPRPRPRPLTTRSITVEREGPNRPAEGRLIPWPEVPTYPVVEDLRPRAPIPEAQDSGQEQSLLDLGRPFFTTAGRTALAWAFKALGLVPGDGVLLPAYHCLAMVEPLEWLGLKPLFYRLHDDLSINFDDLETNLDPAAKALVAVHYFGFPQDGPRLRAFCDATGLALVEDCAHSFYGDHPGGPPGSFGDFTIGSLPKFFPLRGGGCLLSTRRDLPEQVLAAQGRRADLQALVLDLQTAHYYGRLRALRPGTTGLAALAKGLGLLGLGRDTGQMAYSAAGLDFAASRLATTTVKTSDHGRIAARRRHNYKRLCGLLADLPGITLLKPELEPGVVPYMVPLRIPALRQIFASLEDGAVPMQRFGQFLATDLDPAFCPVSSDLSHHGLQLPCHQNLQEEEILWIVERLSEICGINPKV